MKQDEITDLIRFSPANLKEFFDKSISIQDYNVPAYGKIKRSPITYLSSMFFDLPKEEID